MQPKHAVFGTIAFLALVAVFVNTPVFAETVAKSTSFEKTMLIEFVNDETIEIDTIRIWLGKDSGSFKSFKTERGWTGTKTPQGVLVFSSEEPLAPRDSVKIGIKTEIQNPSVNWKVLDAGGNQIATGKVTQDQKPQDQQPAQEKDHQIVQERNSIDDATFKIIPESPKNGDSIRIIGDGFPPNEKLDFYIDNERLDDFATDGTGHLIGRSKIPVTKAADRVDFSLVDQSGNKKTISLRISHAETQMVDTRGYQLKVTTISELVEPGDKVMASGTGEPGSTVVISYSDASGKKIQEAAVPVDTQGNWSYETIIPQDAELGTRTVEFSDGKDTVTKLVSVSVSKTIYVTSSAIQYNPGEKMTFNGTAAADKPVEVVIKDPIGKEIFSDILELDSTGAINFEYPTTITALKGTYVILMTQGDDTEILRVGLGELPSEQIVAKFDKLNYSTTEKAELTIEGIAKSNVAILIVDPSDKVKVSDTVTLGPDGSNVFEIDLTGYKSGVYSVILKHLKSQVEEVFSVGLQYGSGEIKIQSTKQTYALGDSILVLGTTNPNVLLTLEMHDPDGNIKKRKDIFSDRDGKFSESAFRIPSDATQGTWKIKAISGPNYAETELEVKGTITQGFVVSTDKSTYRIGDTMTITGSGAGKTQTAIIKIFNSDGNEIQELLTSSTKAGSVLMLWNISEDTLPGEYKLVVQVGGQKTETAFSVQ